MRNIKWFIPASVALFGCPNEKEPDNVIPTSGVIGGTGDAEGEVDSSGDGADGSDDGGEGEFGESGGPNPPRPAACYLDPELGNTGQQYQCEGAIDVTLTADNYDGFEGRFEFGGWNPEESYETANVVACCEEGREVGENHETACLLDCVQQSCLFMVERLRQEADGSGIPNQVIRLSNWMADHQEECQEALLAGEGDEGSNSVAGTWQLPNNSDLTSGWFAIRDATVSSDCAVFAMLGPDGEHDSPPETPGWIECSGLNGNDGSDFPGAPALPEGESGGEGALEVGLGGRFVAYSPYGTSSVAVTDGILRYVPDGEGRGALRELQVSIPSTTVSVFDGAMTLLVENAKADLFGAADGSFEGDYLTIPDGKAMVTLSASVYGVRIGMSAFNDGELRINTKTGELERLVLRSQEVESGKPWRFALTAE